ncbi:hypothetical protein PPSIR1_37499 [Plesiocystis pacifica SIR-1]|uniref:Peptidase S54 rhomboid domain-containing protein n=1 Tax=Plesiocystis pacifica SIR-1 TaxID=391625 RepID=A6GB25_9BACT|nr:hypothetical protein [Plesiocystis pacifica]EDM76907.1 hypothetical protein PPSIR1_37499 [Plesiocystis pacifica SIR-1]
MLPRFRRGAFGVFALAFLVTMLLGDREGFASASSLQPTLVMEGKQLWTVVTASLRYPEGVGLLGLFVTLGVQWVLGSRLEGFWGTTRYLVMVLVAGLVGYASVIGLGVFVPAIRESIYSGPTPMDAAAVLAFAVVFADQRMRVGSRELSPKVVAAVGGVFVLAFPLVTSLAGGTAPAQVWPQLLPSVFGMIVAVLFVQPWRTRPSSGKVEPSKQRGATHLRIVRTPDDMLN